MKSGAISFTSFDLASPSILSTRPSIPSSRQAQAFFLQQTGDPVAAQQLAWRQLENLRQQQASSLAYFDTFWMMAVLTFAVTFCVFFMKRSVAEKGAHIGSE